MALTVSSPLVRDLGYVVTVDQVAYEAAIEGVYPWEYEATKVSLKLKLDIIDNKLKTLEELSDSGPGDTTGGDSSQNQTLTELIKALQDTVASMQAQLDDLNPDDLQEMVRQAEGAYQNTVVLNLSITSSIISALSNFKSLSDETKAYVDGVKLDVSDIKDIADTLALSFDSLADFNVLSEALYNEITEKNSNTIYFIYGD